MTRSKSLSTFPSLFHEIKKPQSSILNVQSGSKSKFSFSSTHLSPMAPNVEKSLVGYLGNYSRLCVCVSFLPSIHIFVCLSHFSVLLSSGSSGLINAVPQLGRTRKAGTSKIKTGGAQAAKIILGPFYLKKWGPNLTFTE